jgi:hypothetical protein
MLTGTIRPVDPNSPPIPQSMLPLGLTNAQPQAQAQGIMQVNKPISGAVPVNKIKPTILSPVSQPQPQQSIGREEKIASMLNSLKKNDPSRFNQLFSKAKQNSNFRSSMAKGGRVGYADGSQPQISKQQIAMAITMLKKGADMDTISSVTGIPPQMIQAVISKLQQGIQQQAPGGIAGYKTGGIPEIDYRDKGGYVPPIGKKERADDIPAMLSNNEFVFTANAVRNAGGGDVKEGAKKMYALMKKLEGKE